MSATLKVMLNGGVCSVPVAAWIHGEKSVFPEADLHRADVVLVAGGGDNPQRPAAAALVYQLQPWAASFLDEHGTTHAVQSFRCGGLAGNVHFMMLCATCGFVGRADQRLFGTMGIAPCPRCGEGTTGASCRRFHNWGRCPDCEPRLDAAPAINGLDASRLHRATPTGGPVAPKGGALSSLAGSANGGGRRYVGEAVYPRGLDVTAEAQEVAR